MYSEKEKQVYTFPDSTLSADPLELRRKLLLHSAGNLHAWIDQFNDEESELVQAQAEDNLVRTARLAFGLKPLTEKGGVADAVVLEYLAHYLEWLLKPYVAPVSYYPTVRPCTDCPPPR